MVSIKREYKAIDLFKFIASILVVAIHTRPFAVNENIDYFFTCFCRIAVPFFFITTSFFFFDKNQPDIKRYTKRLSLLYLVWFLIELPFVYYRFFVNYDKDISSQIFNFICSFIFNNTWFASWFIMASILSVNIIYYLSKILNNNQLLLIGVIAYILALACSSYDGVTKTFLDERMCSVHNFITDTFKPANSFLVAILYVVLGKIIAERLQNKNIDNLPSNHILLAIIVLLVLLGGLEVYFLKWSVLTNDAFIYVPFLTYIVFLTLLKTELNLSPKTSRFMRSMSILIYILHPIFTFVNQHLFMNHLGFTIFLVTLFESMLFSYLIIVLSLRYTWLKKLY